MLFSMLTAGAFLAASASASVTAKPVKKPFDFLVTFGDSYTDNGRLNYYIGNGGNPPPAGQLHGEINVTASGGLTWNQYASRQVGAKLLDYAVSGATCSNKIISRYFSAINKDFPAVLDDEIPSFVADTAYKSIFPDRTADNTVYALWIGTNDLGGDAFLTENQHPGKTLTDFSECIWTVFDTIYKSGGRKFVLLNVAPLHLAPLYATIENGGFSGPSQFWAGKSQYNVTERSEKIKEYSTTLNTVFSYGAAVNTKLKSRWPKATFDLFDVHSLLTDIHEDPAAYLDAPHNSTGYFHHCPPSGSNCVDQTSLGPLTGFMWYDELHPSTKTDSIIAKHFLDVVAGQSKYGTRYQG
ncbi:GDSL lipase [Neurospora intermedia]|uniref:GDSL lipase n=1 Tax=Neurospora intermedia TaxID=5142 RepID=A0ABR3DHP6_NEUIN